MTINKHLTPIIFKHKSRIDQKRCLDSGANGDSDDDEASKHFKVKIHRLKCCKDKLCSFSNFTIGNFR